MKLWLDDERPAPKGWHHVKTVNDAIDCLRSKKVTHLSLDNDLGSVDHNEEGYKVMDWLEETVFTDPSFPIPEINVHSANASRVQYMKQVIFRLKNKT